MKVNEAIERVNKLKDNAYDDETIRQFIEDCDKQIYREVIETHENRADYEPYEKRYPLDGDDELLADDAYCRLYIFYAISQVDVFNGETDRYTGRSSRPTKTGRITSRMKNAIRLTVMMSFWQMTLIAGCIFFTQYHRWMCSTGKQTDTQTI